MLSFQSLFRGRPKAAAELLDRGRLQAAVDAVPFWWHALDLGQGVVTPGRKTPELLRQELAALQLPCLRDKRVLDIGAWDGFFSFEAERRGAKQVVALDHYVWSVDWQKAIAYREACKERGVLRQEWYHEPEIWQPRTLPGKRGFDLARRALGSRVKPVVADFMEADLRKLGTFDVVLYLGVLYHMRHPLLSLQRLASVTRELAVIETEAVSIPGREDMALCEFFETTELNGDPSNWWAPNRKALEALCRAAGFRRVEVVSAPNLDCSAGPAVIRYRLSAHAWK
jgi:tRNA (mo5U34)-methyltransferase